MGIVISAYWKLFKREDVLDYTPNYVGTWRSVMYPKATHICGSIELYLDPSRKIAQALIIYDDSSAYRTGWKVKMDLQYNEIEEHSLAVSSIESEEVDMNSKLMLSTFDQSLIFRILEKNDTNLSGSYVSVNPSDQGVWSVDLSGSTKQGI